MPDLFQLSGAQGSPSEFAPLHINRMVTGYWSNTNPLRDAATSDFVEKFYGGRQDRIADGLNAELSSRLTLRRRPGLVVYNSQLFPAILRFYGWNTFSLDSEVVRVMADTTSTVYDATGPNTKTAVFQKSPGAGKTFFLGVGNTLYMTNGVDNVQLNNATGVVIPWGIDAPTTAPTVTQQARPNPYPAWQPNAVYTQNNQFAAIVIEDSNGQMQSAQSGTTGTSGPPAWNTAGFGSITNDGSVRWYNEGASGWTANAGYDSAKPIVAAVRDPTSGLNIATVMWAIVANPAGGGGASGPTMPNWVPGFGSLTYDTDELTWQNGGNLMYWPDIGPSTPLLPANTIVDPNGYLQSCIQYGKSGANPPATWQTELGAYTLDGKVVWVNIGPFNTGATGAAQYGYAYQNSDNTDLSNMSPPSVPITVTKGGQVVVQGVGTGQAGVDTIPIYRTPQGGSTFFLLTTIPNPGEGVTWTFIDTLPDSALSPSIQALVGGEGTPLPEGATCMEYHLGRIWVAVGNVVYGSSGPDAIVGGSSGNAGFDITFTLQSRITRFWVTPMGLIIFTVRDSYIIQGNGAPGAAGGTPLTVTKYIENIPLLSYDCFCVFLTTAYLLTGTHIIKALDPSAGIVEASFPIADQINAMDPKNSSLTFHIGGSGETAMYVSDQESFWYRMAPTSTPETGTNWNPPAYLTGGMSAVQSVEVLPGTMSLLVGPKVDTSDPSADAGPILQRDPNVFTDNGTAYSSWADVGNVVLAHSGQLAGLAWMTLESVGIGSATKLWVMLDEVSELPGVPGATFYPVPRTRQDPPNMPPITSYYSNRHSLLQGQSTVWCRNVLLRFEWPVEDAANELMTFTIFGQTWAEQRTQ